MPAASWSYEDWATYEPGTATRLERFRLHLAEVASSVEVGSYNVQGKSHNKAELNQIYNSLLARLDAEERTRGLKAGTQVMFTRGKGVGGAGG